MSSASPGLSTGVSTGLFTGLFQNQPDVVRNFLYTALQLRDLHRLYSTARNGNNAELSEQILRQLEIGVRIAPGDMDRIPRSGPLVIVANHPTGLLDGILLDTLLRKVRPDAQILTNSLLLSIPELQDRCLPVDVDAHSEGNVRTLRKAVELLRAGRCIAFFPAGEVSHWQMDTRVVRDPEWNPAAVRCAKLTGAPIVSLHLSLSNSLAFQMAGMIHPKLRTARLPGELMNKKGRTVEVRIGNPIRVSELSRFVSAAEATRYVRARTYALARRGEKSPLSLRPFQLPLLKRRVCPVAVPDADTTSIASEIDKLASNGATVVESSDYLALFAHAAQIPRTLNEIGRLREVSFRANGEGTGKALDLDEYDSHYQHLVLWHKTARRVAGGYRLAWTSDVLPSRGVKGLYTSTLFRFHSSFFTHLGNAVELGRSFICPEFQKDYGPLLVLWQGLARLAASRPGAPVLFGPVSISALYSQPARELMVRFVCQHSFRRDLAPLVHARHPFRSRSVKSTDLQVITNCLTDIDSLAAPISDLDPIAGIPVLLRQYLKLGGQVAGFNVDQDFSNSLDGLLIIDLRQTSPKLLARYMGPQLAEEYQSLVLPRQSA